MPDFIFFSSILLSGVFSGLFGTTEVEDPRVYKILLSDCYGLNYVFPGNSYVKALNPNVIDLWEVIRFR